MKKLTAALAIVIMLTLIFTACSGKSGADTAAPGEPTDNVTDSDFLSGVVNPLVESDADEVMQKLGFALCVPDGAENVKYFILSGDTEELRFTRNGLDYTARLKATADFEDISGMNYTWTNTLDDEIRGCECRLMRYSGEEGDIDVCLWYDAAPGLMYSLTTSDSSLDGFDITAIAQRIYEPMQKPAE